MRPRLILSLFCSLFNFSSFAHPAPKKVPGRLNVMSYNIRLNTPYDNDPSKKIKNAWPYRKDDFYKMISKFSPQIMGFQEVLPDQLRDLKKKFPQYFPYSVGREDGTLSGEMVPIFFLHEKFDLLAANTIWLSETPTVPSGKQWDAAYPRIMTWVKLQDKENGKVLFVFNTHFDNVGVVAQKESVRLLKQYIPEIAANSSYILLGDFNVDEHSETYKELSQFFRVLPQVQGPNVTVVGNAEWTTLGPAGHKIDFIFADPSWNVISLKISDQKFHGKFPSDHLPVIATFAN
jgi:endonuclease/exonuclease/phosphatase family metal-dependent hydrolase